MQANNSAPILVVDDDPDIRTMLCRILEHEGHRVAAAASGEEALRLARQNRPSLVLLDDVMPGMDGEMVIAEMLADHGKIPPTVLLAVTPRQEARAQEIGAVAGLCKPFSVESLLKTINKHQTAQRNGTVAPAIANHRLEGEPTPASPHIKSSRSVAEPPTTQCQRPAKRSVSMRPASARSGRFHSAPVSFACLATPPSSSQSSPL